MVHRWLLALGAIGVIALLVPPDLWPPTADAQSHNPARLAARVNARTSDDDLRRLARRYEVVTHAKSDDVRVLKTANPHVRVLGYDLPGGQGQWESDWRAMRDEWFAVDTQGLRLKSSSNFWMLRIGHRGYRSYEVDHIVDLMTSAPFDGIWLDVSHPYWAEYERFTNTRGQLTEPAASIRESWPEDMLVFHRLLRASRGRWWQLMNSWPQAPARYETWRRWLEAYLDEVSGVIQDGFGYNRRRPWAESAWRFQVDEIRRITGRGKVVLSKCPVMDVSSEGTRRRLQIFCFASYLLAADGRHAFYEPAYDIGDAHYDEALYGVPLGSPRGAYTKDAGRSLYRRAFDGGLVLVNPSDTRIGNIQLGGTFRTLTGSTVRAVTLDPVSAAILLR